MIKLNGHEIKPTIFPDHTSQVWKIPDEYFHDNYNTVTWEFENESEFMHVAQLKELLDHVKGGDVILELPYLPYARQDKDVSNTATFALFTFAQLLNTLEFAKVKIFDAHNYTLTYDLINNAEITIPNVTSLAAELNAQIVYPDSGAGTRYALDNAAGDVIICEKEREPLTGEIKGLMIHDNIYARAYLIVDDIADGGRTFIEVAKKLYGFGAKEVHLYVSHGIFSKGLEPLRAAGIKRIFTRKGEVDNHVTL